MLLGCLIHLLTALWTARCRTDWQKLPLSYGNRRVEETAATPGVPVGNARTCPPHEVQHAEGLRLLYDGVAGERNV